MHVCCMLFSCNANIASDTSNFVRCSMRIAIMKKKDESQWPTHNPMQKICKPMWQKRANEATQEPSGKLHTHTHTQTPIPTNSSSKRRFTCDQHHHVPLTGATYRYYHISREKYANTHANRFVFVVAKGWKWIWKKKKKKIRKSNDEYILGMCHTIHTLIHIIDFHVGCFWRWLLSPLCIYNAKRKRDRWFNIGTIWRCIVHRFSHSCMSVNLLREFRSFFLLSSLIPKATWEKTFALHIMAQENELNEASKSSV